MQEVVEAAVRERLATRAGRTSRAWVATSSWRGRIRPHQRRPRRRRRHRQRMQSMW